MTIGLPTLFAILTGVGGLIAFFWGVWRFVDAKLEKQRVEFEKKVDALRADHEGQLRELATKVAECVRREEMKNLSDSISAVHRRIDDLWTLLLDKLAVKD